MANSGAGGKQKAGARAESTQETAAKRPRTRRNTQDDGRAAGEKTGQKHEAREDFASAVLGISKLYAERGKDGAGLGDAIAQILLLLLGSGPAIAANEGMQSAERANSLMFYQAVANQQRLNMLGMCTTAKCVRYMFDPLGEEIIDADDILETAEL